MIVGALAIAPAASADTLVAAQGGGTTGDCVSPNPPCDLQYAMTQTAPGDDVAVRAGTYDLLAATLNVPANVNVHGAGNESTVILSSNTSVGVDAPAGGSRVSDLSIVYSGSVNGLRASAGVTLERVYVTTGTGTATCNVIGSTLRDSVCRNTSANGNAVFNNTFINLTITTTLRNVTAIAEGAGSRGMDFISAGGLDHTVDAKNVIADGGEFDVRAASGGASTSTTVNLTHSNYAQTETVGASSSVTPAGSATNQLAAPVFVNRPVGDLHQASDSPTVDAGTTDGIGLSDLDGQDRNQGAAPDIGGDELPVTATPPQNGGDDFPPDTGIRKGPKRKTPKRKAKFEFGGSEPGVTFECRLDVGSRQGSFEPCTSPLRIRGLRRNTKYVFTVRAIDGAGNADPTPADRRWKVTKKKRS